MFTSITVVLEDGRIFTADGAAFNEVVVPETESVEAAQAANQVVEAPVEMQAEVAEIPAEGSVQ
jgi:hypothetical protein